MAVAVHDVIIVGAGPCGLAVAARLCEATPSAIFTDEEHQRYHWLRKHKGKASLKASRTGSVKQAERSPKSCSKHSILVLDGTSNQWMSQWNQQFKTFEISHLRSPMFFHVDPSDRDALVSYTKENNREKDLKEIGNCVGKEMSKHQLKKRCNPKSSARSTSEVTINERDRQDYFTPSTALFSEHCNCIIERYGLRHSLIKQENLQDIQYSDLNSTDGKRSFKVVTNKATHYARTVVLAVGPGKPDLSTIRSEGQCHSSHIRSFPDPSVTAKLRAREPVNMLVVGGGLTSAQIADMAIRRGANKVWLIMRGPYRVKPFDVDLEWVGKYRNFEQARFWNAESDEERLKIIKAARGGGSMTPSFSSILKKHTLAGRLHLHTHTKLVSQEWDAVSQSWSIVTEPPIPSLPKIDYIYHATGVQMDFTKLPYLQNMLKSHPIHGHGGLPCLTDDLAWSKDVPLFFNGRLAALRVGPGAANLSGARIGAERIAWNIESTLHEDEEEDKVADQVDVEVLQAEWATGKSNRYAALSLDS